MSSAEVARLRTISDVETLRALADPLRLAILAALMDGPVPRVMSVKELAEELSEPQTKLYRHMKQLESAGLIRVATSRLVSGIVEQRYQACQHDVMLDAELLKSKEATQESLSFVTAALGRYRDQFFAAYRDWATASPDGSPERDHRRPVLMLTETRVSPARAAEARRKLQEIMDELKAAEDPDGVAVSVLIGFLSPGQDQPAQPDQAS